MGDEDRSVILRRRAIFVASAIAGLGLGAAGCGDSKPEPGESSATPAQRAAEPGPLPCLTLEAPATSAPVAGDAGFPEAPDAGASASAGAPDAGAPDAGKPPVPRPCLTPHPCLKVAAPEDDR